MKSKIVMIIHNNIEEGVRNFCADFYKSFCANMVNNLPQPKTAPIYLSSAGIVKVWEEADLILVPDQPFRDNTHHILIQEKFWTGCYLLYHRVPSEKLTYEIITKHSIANYKIGRHESVHSGGYFYLNDLWHAKNQNDLSFDKTKYDKVISDIIAWFGVDQKLDDNLDKLYTIWTGGKIKVGEADINYDYSNNNHRTALAELRDSLLSAY